MSHYQRNFEPGVALSWFCSAHDRRRFWNSPAFRRLPCRRLYLPISSPRADFRRRAGALAVDKDLTKPA